jgi:DNA-binding SARP family transcriptional activator/tetratricopeptide (TPR) repeat protein
MSGDNATLVRVLGPVDAVVGRDIVELSTLERALLATLAARAGRVASVDHLIESLWGGAAPGSARNRVHALVSSIRRAVSRRGGATEFLETKAPGYLLRREPGAVDAVWFDIAIGNARQLTADGRLSEAITGYQSALDLWRGTPFDGTGNLATPEIQAEVVRLEESRLAAIAERMDAELALGWPGRLIGELTALVAALPYQERLRGQLMVALYRCGRATDAAAVYRDGYRLMVEELGTEPGSELQRLHGAILAGSLPVPPEARQPVAAVPVPALEPPVFRVGPDLADFAGREGEAGRIATLLVDGAVVALTGLAGIGKTSLATHVAHRLRDRYPDGCLTVDMRGTEAVPRSPAHAMATVLMATGTPASALPDDPTDRYRELLANRRLLVVLDNVAEDGQVGQLRPPADRSALLTTSRRLPADLPDAVEVVLDVLPVTAARALLANLIGHARTQAEPRDTDRLIELCGRLPLALRVVGVRLANQPELPLSRLVERMAGLDGRLAELGAGERQVRAGLTVMHARLAPPAARLLGLLATLPTPEVPAWIAAALAAIPVPQAAEQLSALVAAALATEVFEDGHARYRLHDLVRAFAREGIDRAEVGPALRRGYEALLQAAVAAAEALPSASFPMFELDPLWYKGSGWTPEVAAAPADWFAVEHQLLTGAINDCQQRGWLDLAWRLTVCLTVDAGNRGAVDQWCALAEAVLADLDKSGTDPAGAAFVALALGGHLRTRHTPESLRLLRRARLGLRRQASASSAAIAAGQLGMAYRAAAAFRASQAAFDWSRARLQQPADAHYLAQVELGLGNLMLDRGQTAPARAAYERAVVALAHRPNPTIEANAQVCLAAVASRERRFEDAADHYERARAELVLVGDRSNLGRAELGLARTLLRLGDNDRAADFAARALTSLSDAGDVVGHAGAMAVQGRLLVRAGDPQAALIVLRRAGLRVAATGHQLPFARLCDELADALRAAGDGPGARLAIERARAIRVANGMDPDDLDADR